MTDSNQILKVEHISDNSYANRSKDEPSLLVGHRTGLDTNRAEPRACPRSVSSSSSDWSSESGEEFEGTALVSTRHRTPSKVKAIQVAGSGKEEGLNEPVNEPACHSGEGREGGHKIEEKQPENGNATKNSNRFRQKCSSCGVDISSLHYLEQVKHAKQCMSRRKAHGEGCSSAGSNAGSNGPRLLDKDIRDWLKVRFGRYK